MLRRKKTKIAALFLSLAMIILLFTDISPYDVGIYNTHPGTPQGRELNMCASTAYMAHPANSAYLPNPANKANQAPSLREGWGGCQGWCYRRLTYHFFHANALHLFLNLWCFLSCVFLADMSAGKLFAAYFIACTAPALSPVPTVGFSGVCFALLGFVLWKSRNKLEYNAYVLLGIVLPLVVVPHALNNLLHLYCYAVAVILGALQRLRRLTVFGLFVPFGLFVLSDL